MTTILEHIHSVSQLNVGIELILTDKDNKQRAIKDLRKTIVKNYYDEAKHFYELHGSDNLKVEACVFGHIYNKNRDKAVKSLEKLRELYHDPTRFRVGRDADSIITQDKTLEIYMNHKLKMIELMIEAIC